MGVIKLQGICLPTLGQHYTLFPGLFMIRVHPDSHSRRTFLTVGALGAIGLPEILRRQAHAATAKGNRAKRAILVFLGGGLSHHDSFDPKPDAAAEIKGQYSTIATALPGIRFSEKVPLLAKSLSKATLIRSGTHNNDHHETATNWVLSGRFGTPFGDYPAIGAVVAQQKGFTSALPPYVSIPKNPSFTWELGKSAYLGGRYESFRTGDPSVSGYKVEDVSPTTPDASNGQKRRQTLLSAVDDLARKVDKNDQLSTFDEFHKRAANMVLYPEARRAFAIEEESDKLRERYGKSTFGQSCLLARRLMERGVTFATINYGGWDHHAKIYQSLDKKLPDLDMGLSALMEDLSQRGLMEDTLLTVFGEFGRSPKVNKDAGRDHWGQAASLWFAGAGVLPGQVIGATDKTGGFASKRPVSPADVAFTIFDTLGIDPRKPLFSPDGRPIEILDQGDNIHELFA